MSFLEVPSCGNDGFFEVSVIVFRQLGPEGEGEDISEQPHLLSDLDKRIKVRLSPRTDCNGLPA